MRNLKKMISRYMLLITIIIIVVILVVAYVVQILNAQLSAQDRATAVFVQIEQLLEENQQDLRETEEKYRQTCLKNAEAISYIIEHETSVMESVEELKRIAAFMEVDEIHIFDQNGRIFTGTHPEYYDYTFDSGEQMMFFKPMLEDKSLKLVQEIVPNTAEEKMMQYSAIWSGNGEFIVQIGMEPVNVLRVTEKNELAYIFSMLKVNVGVDCYAIDAKTGEIVGATSGACLGKNVEEIGLSLNQIERYKAGFSTKINGVDSYCVFRKIGGNWIGRTTSKEVLHENIPGSVMGLLVCCILVGAIQVFVVTKYMNQYVVNDIHAVNDKLRSITKGNLKEEVNVKRSLEFTELSDHINKMVKSLISNNQRMSYVLSKTNMYIGVYEYNEHMDKVRITEHIPRIFGLSEKEAEALASDRKRFEAFVKRIHDNPLPHEEGIYALPEGVEQYIRIEEMCENDVIFGVAIDVTEEVLKRKHIEEERDEDALTGLYNRRGLENKLEELFAMPQKLRHGALLMIDADGLKTINDKYGHDKGDMYLCKIGNIINGFGINGSVAARLGGDEYVLFLYDYNSNEELMRTIDTLCYIQNNSTAYLGEEESVPLRFSFGYALTHGKSDYHELLKMADEEMYKNKRERKKQLKNM